MKNFKGGGRDFGGGGPKFGGNRHGGGGGGRDRGGRSSEMFAATCSNCHKACEVPFRPSGDKPVYCSECFGKRNQGENRGGERSQSDFRSGERPGGGDRPKQFDSGGEKKSHDHEGLNRKLEALESKMNRILELLMATPKDNTPAPKEMTLKETVKKALKTKPEKASAKKKVARKPKK